MRKLLLLMLVALPCLGDDCPRWNYSGTTGPDFWATLDPAYRLCATGIAQSPIDINSLARRDDTLARLTFGGGASTFRVKNTGNNLKVYLTNPWTLTSFTPAATLEEFHFHVPAEHLDRGYRHAGELHFVFKTATKAYAVAVWIDAGPANNAIASVLANKPPACQTSGTSTQTVIIGGLLVNPQHYATYSGSLTTPPCSEPVAFLITLNPITASPAQIAGLKLLVTGNARPLQGMKFRMAP
jgi:carbonic anhydrase